jgi:hypothetical protein
MEAGGEKIGRGFRYEAGQIFCLNTCGRRLPLPLQRHWNGGRGNSHVGNAMPTLDWIGKKTVVNHYREVPIGCFDVTRSYRSAIRTRETLTLRR